MASPVLLSCLYCGTLMALDRDKRARCHECGQEYRVARAVRTVP